VAVLDDWRISLTSTALPWLHPGPISTEFVVEACVCALRAFHHELVRRPDEKQNDFELRSASRDKSPELSEVGEYEFEIFKAIQHVSSRGKPDCLNEKPVYGSTVWKSEPVGQENVSAKHSQSRALKAGHK